MCMFNDPPPPNQTTISKPKTAWKVFRLDNDSNQLHFPIQTNTQPVKAGWMTSIPVKSYRDDVAENMGFHVFNSWLGAWFYKREMQPWSKYVIRRVKVRGEVFGIGKEFGFRGLRCHKMMVPSITLIQD